MTSTKIRQNFSCFSENTCKNGAKKKDDTEINRHHLKAIIIS